MNESKTAIELDRALHLERNADEAEARVLKLRDRLRFLQQQCNEKKAQAFTLRNDLTMQSAGHQLERPACALYIYSCARYPCRSHADVLGDALAVCPGHRYGW
jgi:hypothetical protein